MSPYLSHPLIYPDAVEERLYQNNIAEHARNNNTLVILPTALGKTVISAMITADLLYNYPGKRILVMAPTRPLVLQHIERFQRIMRFPSEDFSILTGKTPAAYRSTIWNGTSRIVFATPQVVRNDLLKNGLTLKDFGLLVFDECHRAVKEYAYTEVAKHYVNESDFPLILGLTASPGSDFERIKMVCESLFIEHVEHRSDEDEDVKPYIQPVSIQWKYVQLPLQYQPLIDILKGMRDSRINWLQYHGYLKKGVTNVTRKKLVELGVELRYTLEMRIEEERGPMFVAIINQASALTIFHMLELLETQGAYTLKKFLERMESDQSKSHSRLMKEEHYRHLRTFLDGPCYIDHPKIDVLKEALYKQLQDSPDSRILVFTQYRDTAAHLVEQLNNVSGIKAERFVGQASKFQDRGLTQEQQASLIQDLRKGYLNTLVATSIAEEGLDIPEVDLVVFYEPIPSEIRYIQRKGRTGRRAAGSVIILAATNTNDMIYLYASSKRVERMKEISQKLNRILKPFLRLIPKPTPTPIPSEELSKLYSKTGSKPEPLLAYHEKEKLADMNKDVARAERLLYLRILEKGVLDIDNEVLYSEMEEEGYQKNIVATALKRLVKKKYLSSRAMTTSLQVKDLPSAKTMTITVERIFNGGAIVHIADKWRAKLLPEDYNGPRELIKKNNVFRALCELYNSEGILCVKVRQVTQTLR